MDVNKGDSAIIDVDRLEFSMKAMMQHHSEGNALPSSDSTQQLPECCIFKTPVILSRHNESAYIPNAFSIGPFHYDNEKLKATEKIKFKYLQSLISRSPHIKLNDLISKIKNMEKEASNCYAEAINCSPEEFVNILVIDGCFIIEFLRKGVCWNLREEDDPIFTKSCMVQFLTHDLMLLENQVPWMVLETLFNSTNDSQSDISLIELARSFVEHSSFSIEEMEKSEGEKQGDQLNIKDIKHLVDLLWKLSTTTHKKEEEKENKGTKKKWGLLSSATILLESGIKFKRGESSENKKEKEKENKATKNKWGLLSSATSLTEAGIKIKRGESSENILDIKFTDGVLEIPPLKIHETTETAFRNLISFEQCYPNCESRITSYAIALDKLINTTKDMDILCENDIIDNWLNPEDTVKLFNKLYHDTGVNEYFYEDVGKKVNSYCERRWPRWRAVLVRNYFNTPWAILSTSAAIILLILTLLQTIYGIKN